MLGEEPLVVSVTVDCLSSFTLCRYGMDTVKSLDILVAILVFTASMSDLKNREPVIFISG